MKISGFTIARNVLKYNYPILESIHSILPICDEFVVNVGDSTDGTLDLIRSIKSNKIRIIENTWDLSQGKEVLSVQTNLALKECSGDWAFYLQSDEMVHERDLDSLKSLMEKYFHDSEVDTLRFKWFHFYGSYFRYRIDRGWYQKQDRIIKNNGMIESTGDAFGFERKDKVPLKRKNTNAFIYHYGWVQDEAVMKQRRLNAQEIGFISLSDSQKENDFVFSDLDKFPVYFGTHPQSMKDRIESHDMSQKDAKYISQKYWWHPYRILKMRQKTWKRIKEEIE